MTVTSADILRSLEITNDCEDFSCEDGFDDGYSYSERYVNRNYADKARCVYVYMCMI